jgi:hypothetical protein
MDCQILSGGANTSQLWDHYSSRYKTGRRQLIVYQSTSPSRHCLPFSSLCLLTSFIFPIMQFKLGFAPIALVAIGAAFVYAAPAGNGVSNGPSRSALEYTS